MKIQVFLNMTGDINHLGLQQAQLLTKTLVYDGLPENVQSLTGIAEQSDQDELLKRCVLGVKLLNYLYLL